MKTQAQIESTVRWFTRGVVVALFVWALFGEPPNWILFVVIPVLILFSTLDQSSNSKLIKRITEAAAEGKKRTGSD